MHHSPVLSESPSSSSFLKHSQAIFSMHRQIQKLTKDINDYSQSLQVAVELLTLPKNDHKPVADHLKELHINLKVIDDSVKFQENLINQTPSIVKFNPKEIVTGFVSTYRSNKNITMTAVCPEEGKEVFGNLHNLKRILTNLLSNAEKFTPPDGKITIVLTYLQSDSPESDIPLEFSVRDTGPGMTEMVMQRIFTPYAQGGSEISSQYGGTGLGLTTCRTLVEQMGGAISVSSMLGQGSNFTFSILCNRQISTPKKTPPLDSFSVSEESILSAMHDVRNVTGWLISYACFTRDIVKALKKLSVPVSDIEKFALAIESCAESQRHLITQTLDYSKLSLGKTELHIVNFKPEKIVADIVSTFKKKMVIVPHYPQENKNLSGDSEKVKQILTNLISYAIKQAQKTAIISFNYTDSPLALVFKMTFAGGNLESKSVDTDFDLLIFKEMIDLMKGSLSISTIDQELIFTFTIPCQPSNLLRSTNKNIIRSLSALEAEVARILVVDDQKVNRKIVTKLLQKLGCKQVTEAQSGEDGFNKYLECKENNPPFHLIFMDVQMSPMDGIEATGQIRKKEKELKKIPAYIVALSGDGEAQTMMQAEAAGMNEFLVKPVTIKQLKATIRQINNIGDKLKIPQPISNLPIIEEKLPRNTPLRSTSDGFGGLFHRRLPLITATPIRKSSLTRSVSSPVPFKLC